MDLTDEELDITKMRRNKIKYTKLVAENKGLTIDQFKEFYKAYCELYDIACEYMDKFNELYINGELQNEIDLVNYANKKKQEKNETKVDLDKYEITIPLENTGLEDIEYYYKKGDKWYAHYKETQVDKTKVKELEEQAKSKVTEQELKDMILGMLE